METKSEGAALPPRARAGPARGRARGAGRFPMTDDGELPLRDVRGRRSSPTIASASASAAAS